MKKYIQQTAAWALIAILGVFGASSGSVLCVGESGHAALESPAKSCCTGTFDDSLSPSIHQTESETSCCGYCDDLEVLNQLVAHRSKCEGGWATQLALSALVTTPGFLAPSVSTAPGSALPASNANSPSSLFITRQIVASTIIIC